MRLTSIAKSLGFLVFIAALIFSASWLMNKAGVGQGKIPANMAAEEKYAKVESRTLGPNEQVDPNLLFQESFKILNESRQRGNEFANASNRQARALNHQRGSQKVDFWVLLLVVLGVAWAHRRSQTKLLQKIECLEHALGQKVCKQNERHWAFVRMVNAAFRSLRSLLEENHAFLFLQFPSTQSAEGPVSSMELALRDKMAGVVHALSIIEALVQQHDQVEGGVVPPQVMSRRARSGGRRQAVTTPAASGQMVDDLVAQEVPVDDTSKTNRPTALKSV